MRGQVLTTCAAEWTRVVSAPRGKGFTLSRLPSRNVWLALWTATIAAQALALRPVFDAEAPVPGPEVAFRLAGGAFAACGLIAWRRRPDSPIGPLMTATGFGAFVSPLLIQLETDLTWTIAILFGSTWTVGYVALLLLFLSGGGLARTVDRLLVGAFFLLLVPVQLVFLLFLPVEWNLLSLSPDQEVADAIDRTRRWLMAGASLAVVGVLVARWAAASPPQRRAQLPAFAGGVSAFLFAALLVSGLRSQIPSESLWWGANVTLLLVPAAYLGGLLRSRLARAGLAELLLELRSLQGERLQAALARAMGDPGLIVAYAGAAGSLPPARPNRSIATVEREGRPVAALVYDPSFDDDPELVEAVTAAATIALDNERLQAEAEQRIAELRASRERLVAAGDAERRRLERNLHDGAQQRLVALALHLRLLQRRIGDDPATQQMVSAASDQLAGSLAELRELARGIHPAVLNHGLAAALESLAARSPVPTDVTCEPDGELPQEIELAAYFVASEALTNVAKYANASCASVRVVRANGSLVVVIADDGVGGANADGGSGLRGLDDRVEALSGTLRVVSPTGAGTTVIAELPCQGQLS
jgi:signal transduction histidine kinase